jgi:hypothetical protein
VVPGGCGHVSFNVRRPEPWAVRDMSPPAWAAREHGQGSESKLYIWLGITVCVRTREGYTPNSQEDTHGHGAWMAFVSGTWREGWWHSLGRYVIGAWYRVSVLEWHTIIFQFHAMFC